MIDKPNETQVVFDYLQAHIATATMITAATGVVQKSVCRYKRQLEKSGLLVELFVAKCRITNFKAAYLTTNKNLFVNNQLSIWGNE